MTAAAIGAHTGPAMRGAAHLRLAAPADPLLVRQVARVLTAIVLALLALAGMAASGAYLAGPVPAAGPAPGLGL